MTTEIAAADPEKGDGSESGGARAWLKRAWISIRIPVVAVLLSLLIGAIVLLISGANPLQAITSL